MFNEDDLAQMHARPPFQLPLDPRSAERLIDATNVALSEPLAKYSNNTVFLAAFEKEFKAGLLAEDLVGMTTDQATTHIQAVLVRAVEVGAAAQKQQASLTPFLSDEEQARARERAAESVRTAVSKAASTKPSPKKGLEFVQSTRDAIDQAKSLDPQLAPAYLAAVKKVYNPPNTSSPPSPDTLGAAAMDAALSVDVYPYIDRNPTVDSATVVTLKNTVGNVAAQAVQKSEPKAFQPPSDVSCSMSVLSWKETRDIFGRRVANTFVALQVTLRNLNTKNEFLVHDIQVAVDTGVSEDYFGRFQAGRDKLLVRDVAQRGQSEDRRNIIVNVLQATGAMAGAASITAGTVEFKDAVAVFQGSFLTGFGNVFPDHTVEQLNHINDLVFSASNTNKVVVPVQGSVPLVTFISEKPIEQLPFAWCGDRGPRRELQTFWKKTGENQVCEFNQGGSDQPGWPGHAGYPDHYRYDKTGELKKDSDFGDDKKLDPWPDLHFRHWQAAAFRMLQEHTFVVVGGIHIQEIATQPKLASLDCTLLTGRQVDISKLKDGTVNCTVTGSGLSLVTAIALKKNGSSDITGTIPSNDGNSATLQFKPDDLCGAEGTYSLFLTYKSDSQKDPTPLDSGDSVLLAKQPSVGSIAFDSPTSKLTVTGKCLDQLNDVALAPDGKSKDNAITGTGLSSSDTTATATFTGLKDPKYYLVYSTKLNPPEKVPFDQSKTVSVSKVTSQAAKNH